MMRRAVLVPEGGMVGEFWQPSGEFQPHHAGLITHTPACCICVCIRYIDKCISRFTWLYHGLNNFSHNVHRYRFECVNQL